MRGILFNVLSLSQEIRNRNKKIFLQIITSVVLAFFITILTSVFISFIKNLLLKNLLIGIIVSVAGLGASLYIVITLLKPQTKLENDLSARILYNAKKGIILPLSLDYMPQRRSEQIINIVTGRNPEFRKEMKNNVNPIFQGEKSVFTELMEFIVYKWLCENLLPPSTVGGIKKERQIKVEKLRNNTFINFFSTYRAEGIMDGQFTRLDLHIPEDFVPKFTSPVEIENRKTNPNTFQFELDGNYCNIRIFTECIPGRQVTSWTRGPSGGEILGMPICPLDERKLTMWMEDGIFEAYYRINIEANFSYPHLIFFQLLPDKVSQLLNYNPSSYTDWVEKLIERFYGDRTIRGFSWRSRAEIEGEMRKEKIYSILKTIQRNLDEVPDPEKINEEFLEKHLEVIQKEKERWKDNESKKKDSKKGE